MQTLPEFQPVLLSWTHEQLDQLVAYILSLQEMELTRFDGHL